LILLTGIPGTGKTTVGNHLAAEHGFRYLDFEDIATLRRMLQFGERGFRKQIAALKQRNQDTVVSWGFVPDSQLGTVRAMRGLGFEWVWLDGDRDAARRMFLQRGTVSEELLDVQMAKIDRFLDLDKLKPRIINPFDDNGNFRDLEVLAAEIARL
jgi:gluconate kinase